MEKTISFKIEDDIYDKFCLALNLSKEEENRAVENLFEMVYCQDIWKGF